MHSTGSSSNKPAILVKDLWKSYNGTEVLKGLSLEVPEGKTAVIIGRSGVGKSVLLRQILGLEEPDKGTIEIDGIPISKLSQKEIYKILGRFGMLFQSSALFDSLTVGENVAFYLQQHGDPITMQKLSPKEIQERTEDALKKVGLPDYQKKMPSELSGGQKRRAALARLIIYRPKIMLYDEPTTGLDPITAGQINDLIQATQKELHATSIVVTHDMTSALELGDLFALHQDGKIVEVNEKESFLKSQNPTIQKFLQPYGKLGHE
jgi:phospholipid/cholesterol/gamma-HCH transport system ATP-binding protein